MSENTGKVTTHDLTALPTTIGEAVARAMCKADGKAPDETVPVPDPMAWSGSQWVMRWKLYSGEAERFLAAHRVLHKIADGQDITEDIS